MKRAINYSRPWYAKAISLLPDQINGMIIELGSGNKELAALTKTKIKNLTMTDIAGDKDIMKADFNHQLPFKSSSFTGAISLEVIEHLINHELFLKEIHRILKSKGWLIISTPNISWWGYRLMALIGQPPKKEGYHLRFFTDKFLSNLLIRKGFIIEKKASFTTLPIINRFLSKPIYPVINFWPNFLAQDLVYLCRKK